MMDPLAKSVPSQQVFIYENERAWIGGGFSKKGLMPNDPRPFSTKDGSLSWKTLEEASAALLGKGWEYEETEFTPQSTAEDGGDDEGWLYSTNNFNAAFENVSRGMTHYVRRRALSRQKLFHPERFLPHDVYSKCDCCDSNAIDALSSKILEALSFATLLQQNNQLTDAVALTLKEKVIETLGIQRPLIEFSGSDCAARLDVLHKELDFFGEREQTALSKVSQVLHQQILNEAITSLDFRSGEVSARYFGKEERDAFAGLALRHLDPEYGLHCDKELCGEECQYHRVTCPNQGCDKSVSRVHLDAHDERCGHKIVPCPKECGDEFPRNRTEVHLADACNLRDAECPFATLGCTSVVPAKDAEKHVVEASNSHLLLTMNRMMEYQDVFRKMNARIGQLEKENAHLKQEVKGIGSTLEWSKKKHASTDRDMKSVSNKVGGLSKKLGSHESHCKSEFKQVKKLLVEPRSHVK